MTIKLKNISTLANFRNTRKYKAEIIFHWKHFSRINKENITRLKHWSQWCPSDRFKFSLKSLSTHDLNSPKKLIQRFKVRFAMFNKYFKNLNFNNIKILVTFTSIFNSSLAIWLRTEKSLFKSLLHNFKIIKKFTQLNFTNFWMAELEQCHRI